MLKTGLGQQLGHALALRGSQPSNYQAVKGSKGLKTAEKGPMLLTGGVAIPTHAAFSPFSWGMPTKGGMRRYQMNPLAICAWRHLPWPERPDKALGRHS